jgi:hypothetical protein
VDAETPPSLQAKVLKRALFLSTFAALRDPVSRIYYARKIQQGEHHNQALIALARRRCDVLFTIPRDGIGAVTREDCPNLATGYRHAGRDTLPVVIGRHQQENNMSKAAGKSSDNGGGKGGGNGKSTSQGKGPGGRPSTAHGRESGGGRDNAATRPGRTPPPGSAS